MPSRILTLHLYIFTFLTLLLASSTASSEQSNINNVQQVERGKIVYQRFCSLCHGKHLKGQKNWRTRKPNGKLPAPPHDENGHTWHHADELLFGIIKYGLVPPYGPKNYPTDMPAWGSTLQDSDIWAVLTYIKSTWPKEQQDIQAEMSGGQ